MIIRSLLTALGFDVDDKKINKYNEGFKKAIGFTKVFAVAVAGLGVAFLKSAGDMEQTQIAFETMLGSAEEADKLIKDITQFAAKTPFELTGLVQSSKQLLAFGFGANEIIGTMTNLGNIAAGVGRDKLPTLVSALGKIRTKGRASMEQLNMMLEAGVPILDQLAKNAGKSTDEIFKMVSKGEIGFKEVNQALQDMATGNGIFSGLMEKQSKSFLGIISNIGDFFSNLAISIGQDLLPDAKAIVKAFLEFMEANKEIIKKNIVGFFKKLGFFIALVFLFFKRLFIELKKAGVIDFLAAAFETLVGILGWAIENFIKLIGFLWEFKEIALIVGGVIAGLGLALSLNPIGAVIAGIAALIGAIMFLVKNWDAFAKFFVDLWNAIVSTVTGIWDKIVEIAKNVWTSIVDTAKSIWKGFSEFFINLWENIVKTVKGIWDKIVEIVMGPINAIKGLLEDAGRFLGLVKDTKVGLTAGEAQSLIQFALASAGAGGNSSNLNVNSTIQVAVPEGTPDQQKQFLETAAQMSVTEAWNKILSEGLSSANTGGQ